MREKYMFDPKPEHVNTEQSGMVQPLDHPISPVDLNCFILHIYQVLATAVRMCKWDKILTVRAEAAETLG